MAGRVQLPEPPAPEKNEALPGANPDQAVPAGDEPDNPEPAHAPGPADD